MTLFCTFIDDNGNFFALNDMLVSREGQDAKAGPETVFQPYNFSGPSRKTKLVRYSQKSVIIGQSVFFFSGGLQWIKIFLDRIHNRSGFDFNKFQPNLFISCLQGLPISAMYLFSDGNQLSWQTSDCDIEVDGGFTIRGDGSGFDVISRIAAQPNDFSDGRPDAMISKYLGSLVFYEIADPMHHERAFGGAYELIQLAGKSFKKLSYRLDYFAPTKDEKLRHVKTIIFKYFGDVAYHVTYDPHPTQFESRMVIGSAPSLSESDTQQAPSSIDFFDKPSDVNVTFVQHATGFSIAEGVEEYLRFVSLIGAPRIMNGDGHPNMPKFTLRVEGGFFAWEKRVINFLREAPIIVTRNNK
jgi:hypothetical protein